MIHRWIITYETLIKIQYKYSVSKIWQVLTYFFGNHVQVRTISQKSYNCISMDHDFSKKNLPNIGKVNLLVMFMWNNCTSMDHFSKIIDHCFSHKKTGFTQFFNNFCFFLSNSCYMSVWFYVCIVRYARLHDYRLQARTVG